MTALSEAIHEFLMDKSETASARSQVNIRLSPSADENLSMLSSFFRKTKTGLAKTLLESAIKDALIDLESKTQSDEGLLYEWQHFLELYNSSPQGGTQ